MAELTPITWDIVLSFIVPDDATPSQRASVKRAVEWLVDHLDHVAKAVRNKEEESIIRMVADHWRDYHEPPTLHLLEHKVMARQEGDQQISLQEFQTAMTEFGPDLKRHDADDLPALVDLRAKERKVEVFQRVLKNAMTINAIGVPQPGKGGTKIHLQGPDDARRYVLQWADAEDLRDGKKPTRCSSAPDDPNFDLVLQEVLAEDDGDMVTSGSGPWTTRSRSARASSLGSSAMPGRARARSPGPSPTTPPMRGRPCWSCPWSWRSARSSRPC